MTFGAPYTALGARLAALAAGVVAVAILAFAFAVALVATVATASREGRLDPGEVAAMATPVGLVAAGASMAGVLLARHAVWRSHVRARLPLYEAMVLDAGRVPGTSLVEVRHRPGQRSAGCVLAVDIESGWQRSLRLPVSARVRGTVVCLAETLDQPDLMAWMSGALWQACRRESERAAGRAHHLAATRHGHRWPTGRRKMQRAAHDAVATAEEILKEHNR